MQDEIHASIHQYINNLSYQLNQSIAHLTTESLISVCNDILMTEAKGGRVHITGIGKPGHLAHYIASLLSSTGTPAYFLDATETIHGSAGQVVEGDVVIAISNSGETQELKTSIETLKRNGAMIIAVTRDKNSWLAQHAKVTLLARVDDEGDRLNKAPRASIIIEMIMLQLLSILLQEKKELTLQTYLQWHPGGALGASILKEKNNKE